MFKAKYIKHVLEFILPGGTSRGVLTHKPSWYIHISDEHGHSGIGEVSLIPGLSPEDPDEMDQLLNSVCENIETVVTDYPTRYAHFPALRFGIEMALRDLAHQDPFVLFPSDFTKGATGIGINGLIWMGSVDYMLQQVERKLNEGFSCLKLKIGAIDFDTELGILKNIRQRFSKDVLELRVDANGAFAASNVLEKLNQLSKYDLHSIEQPIKAGQWDEMANVCSRTPLPIALDEELIGVVSTESRQEMLDLIKPQFIIIKPSLTGGFATSEEWISYAKSRQVGWWITSALEGNIGLNAIAQWTHHLKSDLPQGLGTGQVFKNNVESPLYLKGEELYYNPNTNWGRPFN